MLDVYDKTMELMRKMEAQPRKLAQSGEPRRSNSYTIRPRKRKRRRH